MLDSPGSQLLLTNQGTVIVGGIDGSLMMGRIELYERG